MAIHARRFRWQCDLCDHLERLDMAATLARLRAVGILKRETEPDPAYLVEVARSSGDRLHCPVCGEGDFLPQVLADDDDWELPVRLCAACGQAIPPERQALFPTSSLCAKCQSQVDAGQSPDKHDDFCPRCGTRMITRLGRGAGVSRYQLICPSCRR